MGDRASGAGALAIGIAIGVALGVAMDNVGAGIAIGVAIGMAFGASHRRRSKTSPPTEHESTTEPHT